MVWGGGGGGGGRSRGTGGHRGEFNDTVFEDLGAKSSKDDVVELWWGVHGPNGESIWLRGVIASTSPRGLMVKASALKCKVAGSIPAGVNGVQRHRF